MLLISPYSRPLRNGQRHPKNYPWWPEVIRGLSGHEIVQVGSAGEESLVPDHRVDLPLDELAELVKSCTTWISVDNFFQHFCWDLGKRGVVIFSRSDPLIFGHPENINLLKGRRYLRPDQFRWWEQAAYDEEAYVKPAQVVGAVLSSLLQEVRSLEVD